MPYLKNQGPFGTLYSRKGNPRTTAIRAAAAANNLELAIEHIESADQAGDDYLTKINPLGKVPSFVGADGFVLTECIAIAVYITRQNKDTNLLGESEQEFASVLRWMSYVNSDVYDALGNWFLPIIGRRPFDEKSVQEAIISVEKRLRAIENQLASSRYLAGDTLSLADLFAAGMLSGGFQCFFDAAWRKEHPEITRWCQEVTATPIYQAVAPGELVMIEKAIPNKPIAGSNFSR